MDPSSRTLLAAVLDAALIESGGFLPAASHHLSLSHTTVTAAAVTV